MMKKISHYIEKFKKGLLINRLMKIYSLLIILFFGMLSVILAIFIYINDTQIAMNELDIRVSEMAEDVTNKNIETSRIMEMLFFEGENYQNMMNYMTQTKTEYFSDILDTWHQGQRIDFASEQLKSMLYTYPDVSSIDIVVNDLNYFLRADERQPYGQRIEGNPVFRNKAYLVRSIKNPDSGQVIGTLYVNFKPNRKENNLEHDEVYSTIVAEKSGRILSQNIAKGNPLLSNIVKQDDANGLAEQVIKERYFYRYIEDSNMYSVVLLAKHNFYLSMAKKIGSFILMNLSISLALLILLKKVFIRYSKNVNNINQEIHAVIAGDWQARIDTKGMELELLEISEAINQMLEYINQSFDEIYTLEIKQRDAHMRALQSQINPHFLYNTLEYIRMYAVSCEQDELADVVYAFAALLRNNINQEKTTTLKKELDFCEKYAFLYQIRYPDRIAYHVTIEKDCQDIVIPKFIIQPLVENYFVHGIDYTRINNVISIKSFSKDNQVIILIRDNGSGIPPEKLTEIQQNLQCDQEMRQESIGLKNIYLRLQNYFNNQVSFDITSKEKCGTGIEIKIPKEVIKR
ncbi:two-component system, sensor histidine kinase YesM [Granulicatella balaenopterae]|uniref:Two-component system, sensor histidine kinase YesM n=1 Tax=Granulicatella balaenopterae TaxID=137733 RepID=A0A1H9KCW4_9LACT|nr:sensor histidine kinase [Granulicatella balaenopterae]SEQ96990.1 two-component system, sensor histidine kinase YesM [Granulicatella balaenopterae]